MTTANELIDRAYTLIGFKDASEPLIGADATYALDVMNAMIDGWNTQRLFIVSVNEIVANVSGLPITIGPGQMIDVARPVDIEDGSFIRINNVDFPITWITREEYNNIAYKQVTANVSVYGYYDKNLPTGNIYLWPYQDASAELHLQLQQQLTEFADLTTQYTLAPGYKKALSYSLAEELAAGLRPLDPLIARTAVNARRAIRRTNAEIPQLDDARRGFSPIGRFLSGL